MGPRKKKEPGCWRCSQCNLNYPDDTELENCVVCDSKLAHFTGITHDEDLIEKIKAAVWKRPEKKDDYVGPSAREAFDKRIESLVGVDDFLMECGDTEPEAA